MAVWRRALGVVRYSSRYPLMVEYFDRRPSGDRRGRHDEHQFEQSKSFLKRCGASVNKIREGYGIVNACASPLQVRITGRQTDCSRHVVRARRTGTSCSCLRVGLPSQRGTGATAMQHAAAVQQGATARRHGASTTSGRSVSCSYIIPHCPSRHFSPLRSAGP